MYYTVVITRVAYKIAEKFEQYETKGEAYFYFPHREIVQLNFSRHLVRFYFVAAALRPAFRVRYYSVYNTLVSNLITDDI